MYTDDMSDGRKSSSNAEESVRMLPVGSNSEKSKMTNITVNKVADVDESLEVNHVSDIIGPLGPYQKKIFYFFFICGIFSAWNSLALAFYAPSDQLYWCENPKWTENNVSIVTQATEIRHSINYTACVVSGDNHHSNSSSSNTCTKFVYDTTNYPSTIINEWDLVCSRSWLISMAKSSYMIGTLVAVMISQVADKYGRFPVVIGGIITEVAAGLLSASATSVPMYLICRFFLALGNAARWGSGFVLIVELVGVKYRSDLGIGINFGWAAGYMVLPLIAYFIRGFRTLQLCLTLPEVIFIYFAWKLVPESPRWQLTHGKFSAAKAAIKHMAQANFKPIFDVKRVQSMDKVAPVNGSAKVNGKGVNGQSTTNGQSATNGQSTANGQAIKKKTIPEQVIENDEVIDYKLNKLVAKFTEEIKEDQKSINLFDLWKSPNLRRKTAILYLTWAVNGFVYYGLSFNTNSLEGNPYLNFAFSGFVEVPAYAVTLYLLKRYGNRKPPLIAAMVGAGCCFILVLPFHGIQGLVFEYFRTSLAMIGKLFITCSFAIIYLYSAEIYPTVARGVGIGSSSMAARVGAISAPFVKELGEATHVSVALAIFGALALFNSWILYKFAEETHGKEMPDTIKEAEDA